ncbi:MAG TPA: YihY/virulence factor BrkB family protein [Thermohalobaculum sp.]|nr:YihY/virulence factor BrkB family protein [Thermohalobaculum sp.]
MTRIVRIARVAWPFLKAVVDRYFQHEGSVIAGYMAFSAMLAIVPFLLFATALTGYVVGREGGEAAIETLFNAVPPDVALTLEPVLMDILQGQGFGLITLAAIGALYVASNGAEAVRVALDRAYEADIPRNFLVHYLFSFAMVVLGFIVFIVLAGLIIVAPLVYYLLQREAQIDLPFGANAMRYALAIAIFWAYLWVVHKVLPSRRMRGFVIWPGIMATLLILIASAAGFSYYLSQMGTYTVTYGTLAGVMITLIFLYITATAIILGGEINAVANADKLVTVIADEELLDALDSGLDEEDRSARASDVSPEERAQAFEAREQARLASGEPLTPEAALDQARSPAERAEADVGKAKSAGKAKD